MSLSETTKLLLKIEKQQNITQKLQGPSLLSACRNVILWGWNEVTTSYM